MRAMHIVVRVSNSRKSIGLLGLLLYCQTCLATADEIVKRQGTSSSLELGKLETPTPAAAEITVFARQFTTETVPPDPSSSFDTSLDFTSTFTSPPGNTTPDIPTPPPPPPATVTRDTTSTTTTRTSTSPSGTTSSTTFRNRPSATTSDSVSTTITGGSNAGSTSTPTTDGAEVADATSSFIVEEASDFDLYTRMQELRTFGIAAIVLLVINALLISIALGFAIFVYFKQFRGNKQHSYATSTFSSSSTSLLPHKRQSMVSKATWATPSLSGTVPRALAGRQIPSHHYPRRSWDQVTTIASTSTESERRRRQRVSRVEEESEDASLADDPLRRSMQSSTAETDMSMIRSSSGVSVTLESSGRGTGVR